MKYFNLSKLISFILLGVFSINIVHAQSVNMDRYISLGVQAVEDIRLYFMADQDNTPIKVVSGNQTYNLIVDHFWSEYQLYTAGADTMTVYGNVERLNCSGNYYKLNKVDASHNPFVTDIYCENNQISHINVSNNPRLEYLNCYSNLLTTLDVSTSKELKGLNCYDNQLTTLDLNSCTSLEGLNCQSNRITTLNIGDCKYLTGLDCQNNQLSSINLSQNIGLEIMLCSHNQIDSLDLSNCRNLKLLSCMNNNFSTQSLDALYCSLYDRTDEEVGSIRPLFNAEDENYDMVTATNKQNALNKNWKIQYYTNDADIPTTGNYTCTDAIENIIHPQTSIYPNPVTDILHIDTPANKINIQIYNISGALVSTIKNKKNISVTHLPKGIYTIKVLTEQDVYNQKIVKK